MGIFLLAWLLVASPSAPTEAPALTPISTVRLSGTAASGLAAAYERLWVTHYESNQISQVDPLLDRETAALDIGPLAASVSNVGGWLWIAHYGGDPESSHLTMLDPASGAVALRVAVPDLCCEVAGSRGKIWALDPRGALLALDPGTGQRMSSTPVTLAPNVHAALVADEWAVWVSSDTTPLLEVDPETGSVVSTIDVGGGIPMTIAFGLVWGAGPHHVWAVDPFTKETRVSFPLENTIEVFSIAVTETSLWTAVRRPGYVGRVLRLDRATGQLLGEAEVALPARVVELQGDIFVVDWETNSLFRFRP
jgi:outer membrane protein assembly factor BamB